MRFVYGIYNISSMIRYTKDKEHLQHPKPLELVLAPTRQTAEHIAGAHLKPRFSNLDLIAKMEKEPRIRYEKILPTGLLRTTKSGWWHTIPIPMDKND